MTARCDFPDNATCEVPEEELSRLKPKEDTLVYLTFDDGPFAGTNDVLDVLKQEDVKAGLNHFAPQTRS